MSKLNISFNNKNYNIDKSALSDARTDFVSHLGTIAGEGLKIVVDGVVYNVDATKLNDAASSLEALLDSLGGSAGGLEPITWDGNTEGRESFQANAMYTFYKVSDAVVSTDDVLGGMVGQTLSSTGESYEDPINEQILNTSTEGMIQIGMFALCVYDASKLPTGLVLSNGVYFSVMTQGDTVAYTSSLTFPS